MGTIKKKARKATGYEARPWLKLIPRVQPTISNRARLYLPSGVLTLDQEVVASPVTMSLDEAATVTFTIADPSGSLDALALASTDERELLSGVDVRWRRIWWRITRIERDEQSWIVVCEDRVAAYLRAHKRLVTASRSKTTRAQFVHRLTKGVKAGGGIPVYIPELREKQGIYKPEQPKAKKTAKSKAVDTSGMKGTVWDDSGSGGSAGGGWGDAASKIRVKRSQATSAQLKAIDTVLRTAQELGATERVMVACVMCITQESNAGDPYYKKQGDAVRSDTIGTFQQGPEWISRRNVMDDAKATRAFLLGHEANVGGTDRTKKGWKQHFGSVQTGIKPPLTLGGMIFQVQRGGAGAGQWEAEAKATVKLWLNRNKGGGSSATTGAASGPDDADRYYRGQYKFRTSDGEPMAWWDSMGVLADEVNWHRWAVSNTLGFATDGEMIRGNPVIRVSRDIEAVHQLRWTWDTRRQASSLTARIALTDPLAILPGMVAMVDDEEPVSGRWLVESVEVDPTTGSLADVTFRRPGAKLLEPAPELRLRKESSRTIGGKGDYGNSVFGEGDEPGSGDIAGPPSPGPGDVVSRTYAAALEISRQTPGYLYGGGHGPKIGELRGSQGLDCSSSTSLALYKAGAFKFATAIVSGKFATSWGEPGRGKRMTIWANTEHVWIEFHEKGYKYSRFDTSGHGEGRRGDGPKMRETRRTDQSRFTARHWPGT